MIQRLPLLTVLVTSASRSSWSALDNLVVTNALASIRADLGASLEALEWTVNAYTLAFAVLLLTGAALGDRFGRRRDVRRRPRRSSPPRPRRRRSPRAPAR